MTTLRDIINLLKGCAKGNDLNKGATIHADILKQGIFWSDIFIGSTLVNMYAKCGSLAQAQQVFDELPIQDAVSWNVLLTGYAQHGHGGEALNCVEHMESEGIFLDAMTYPGILKACASIGAAQKGKRTHSEIVKKGWVSEDHVLGTALVDMYAKCGALAKAQLVFDELPTRDVVSWNALISGYAHHGHGDVALKCFDGMKCDGFTPNPVTFACVLKACGASGAIEKGKEIHDDIVREGWDGKDSVLGTALVDMYMKCSALIRAQQVFDELLVRDVFSWNALIGGYCQHGQSETALECFEKMKREGDFPDETTFAGALQACANLERIEEGYKVHARIVKEGLHKSNLLGNALVNMFSKCGALSKARCVFDELHTQDVISWNALITSYAKHGRNGEAIHCFTQMQSEGLSPDAVTFLALVKACGSIETGKEVHAEMARKGFLGKDIVLGSALVDMYAKQGLLAMAQEVFEELPAQDVVSWTALILAYAQHHQGEEALQCFERMQGEGFFPNPVTFACVLKACGCVVATKKGKEIHAKVAKQGLLGENIVLGNALVDMYATCGAFKAAQQAFDELADRDVVSWNALLGGFAEAGEHDMVINLYKQMIHEKVVASPITFSTVLKACKSLKSMDEAQEICEVVTASRGVIPTLEHCACMVEIFGQAGQFDRAMRVIQEMPVSDDIAVWFALMGSCQKWGNVELGKFAFDHAVLLDEKSVVAYICMSSIYASAGMQADADNTLAKAKQVFDSLQLRDVCAWDALIVGLVEHDHGKEALDTFDQMQLEGLCVGVQTCLCILTACSSVGAVEKGMEAHSEIVRSGLLETDSVLGNALVTMYSKCGALGKAREVFNDLLDRDLVCWTSLIAGYGQHGQGQEALICFKEMMGEGVLPDAITFACILKICSGIGAVEAGQMYFDAMHTTYGITPILKHYALLVELLSHAGYFEKAIGVIEQMPSSDCLLAWFALLSDCKKWGNINLGRFAFDHTAHAGSCLHE